MKTTHFISLLLLLAVVFLPASAQEAVVPDPFDLIYPVDGLTVNGWGEFEPWIWEIAPNATGYDFYVERTSPTSEVIFDEVNIMPYCDNSWCYMGFEAADLVNLTDGTYTWNVTARDGTDTIASSNGSWSFTIDSTADLPARFGLWYPYDGETFNAITDFDGLTWEWAENSTSFTLDVYQTIPSATTIIDSAVLTPADDADGLTCFESGECLYIFTAGDLAQIIDGGTYEWNVVANGTDGFSVTWDVLPRTFSINSTAVLPEWVQFWYPNQGQVFNSVNDIGNWLWRNAINVDTYDLIIDGDGGPHYEVIGLTPADDADELTCSGRRCDFVPPADLINSVFTEDKLYWINLTANNADGFKIFLTEFRLDANAVIPGKTTPLNPPTGIVYNDGNDILKFQWTVPENTDYYGFWLQRNFPIEDWGWYVQLTPEVDDDNLSCTDTRCTFTLDPEQIPVDGGQYEWGLQSWNSVTMNQSTAHPEQMVFFMNPSGVELLENGDMEIDEDGNKVPDGWVEQGTNKLDKIKCNKDKDGDNIVDKFFAYRDDCSYRFRGEGTEGARLKYVISYDTPTTYDELHLNGFVETKNAIANKGSVKMMVLYVDEQLEKDKTVVKFAETTQKYLGFHTAIAPQGDIAKVKVQLRYKGQNLVGKVYFDNMSLLGLTNNGNGNGGNNLVPLPAAPENAITGFRNGN